MPTPAAVKLLLSEYSRCTRSAVYGCHQPSAAT